MNSESAVSSGSAPARAKTATHKKRTTAAKDKSETAIAAVPVAVETSAPSFDDIAQLAYSYWEARGYQPGSPEEDWLRAEYELRAGLTLPATH